MTTHQRVSQMVWFTMYHMLLLTTFHQKHKSSVLFKVKVNTQHKLVDSYKSISVLTSVHSCTCRTVIAQTHQ